MRAKALELRDRATFIPVLAVELLPDDAEVFPHGRPRRRPRRPTPRRRQSARQNPS